MRIHGPLALLNVFVAALSCASPAIAQTDAAPGDADARSETTQQLEQIEVLGSHIRNIDIETQHPLLTLDRAGILRTGLTSIADIVQDIVANGETFNRAINSTPNGGNNSGEQLVNLRSLGANRTLVLLNGQRFVTDINGAVDLSAIPLALVERVEVMLDGASAIYGSDAIAGVINIITRRDYDGGEFGAYLGHTSYDDGTRRAYDLSFGRKGDGWSASGGIEYSRDDPIFAGARTISAVPVFGLPPGTALTGSAFTPYSFLVPDSLLNSNPDFLPLRLIDGRPGTSPSDFRTINIDSGFYNYAPLQYLQTPQERRSAFAQVRYEFGPALAANADVLFNQHQSRQQLSPSDIHVDATDSGNPDAIAITTDNAYNPFGEPIDFALRRFVEAGPRTFHQTDDTLRVHLGLDGAFSLGQRDFTWNADAATTRSRTTEFTGPLADYRKLALALGPSFFDATGTAQCGTPGAEIPGCVPLNLFGPPGSITPAMLDYVGADETNRRRDESSVAGIGVSSTELLALPGGALGFAAGADYRRESSSALLDPLEAGGFASGNGVTSTSTRGAYSISEAYVEFDAPLLADKPFARKLNVVFGSRFSHYSNFGSTTNSQIGLRWQPIEELLARANYTEGFRAPSVDELFGGAVTSTGISASDPCDTLNNPAPSVRARCTALGVPADFHSLFYGATVSRPAIPTCVRKPRARVAWAWFTHRRGWTGSAPVRTGTTFACAARSPIRVFKAWLMAATSTTTMRTAH